MSLLESALAYARAGWCILPCWPIRDGKCGCVPVGLDVVCCAPRESPGKHPIGDLVPRGLSEATSNEAVIRSWWGRVPDASPALALVASDLIAFDIDYYHGDREKLAALEAVLGPLPDTVVQASGSGEGAHLIYQAPPFPIRGVIVPPGFDSGVTMRGRNYIVLAPSTHLSGGRYAWYPGRAPWEVSVATLPPTWLEALKRPVSAGSAGVPSEEDEPSWLRAIPSETRYAKAKSQLLTKETGEIKGVSRQSELTDVCRGVVRGHALRDPANALELILECYNKKCKPPYPEYEVARKVVFAYDDAILPEWGERLKSHEMLLGEALAPFGLPIAPPAPVTPVGALPILPAHVDPPANPDLAPLLSEVAVRDKPPVKSYTTGIPDLDRALGGGLTTRQLLIIAAPPADGKSAIVVDMTLGVEKCTTHPPCFEYPEGAPPPPILYASTELESDEIAARYAANVLDCAWTTIVRGMVPRERVVSALTGRRIRVIGCETLPRGKEALAVIIEVAARMKEEYGVAPVVVLDYLQDLARGGKESDLRGQIGDLATDARAIAQALDCPVVAVCSVSRSYYGAAKQAQMRASTDPRVYLAAAKESGDVDYAAASVIFLDVDVAEEGSASRPARLAVAKARHGQPAFVGAKFYGASGRWAADADALTKLSPEGQGERDLEEYATRVTETLANRGPSSGNALVKATRGRDKAILDAAKWMVGEGKAVLVVIDPVTGRRLKDPLYALPDQVPRPPPGSGPDPALASYVREARPSDVQGPVPNADAVQP